VDAEFGTGIRLSAGEWFDVRFSGAPRWLNHVEVATDAGEFRIEVLDLNDVWLPYLTGRGNQDSEPVSMSGANVRARGLRFVPLGILANEPHLFELAATHIKAHPDHGGDANRPSLYYEYVEDYSNWRRKTGDWHVDLDQSRADALGLEANLIKAGWASDGGGELLARMRHWSSAVLGGTENKRPDDHDLAYFAGHGLLLGGETYMLFNTQQPDFSMHSGKARGAWGDRDVEWVALAGCKILNTDAMIKAWFKTMNGLHLLLGWVTNCPDKPIGKSFGWQLRDGGAASPPLTLKRAWFRAADAYHSRSWRVAVVAENVPALFDDYAWVPNYPVAPDPVHGTTVLAQYYTTSLFFTGSPQVRPGMGAQEPAITLPARSETGVAVVVPKSILATQDSVPPPMPRYVAQPVTVDVPYVTQIASTICSAGGPFCRALVAPATKGLAVGAVDGAWEMSVESATAAPHIFDSENWLEWRHTAPLLPLPADAVTISDSVLTSWGLRPAGAVPFSASYLRQVALDTSGPDDTDPIEIPDSTFDTAIRVDYRRHLDDPASSLVAGPGGWMSVTLGDGGKVQQIHRGAWRPFVQGSTVPLVPLSTVLNELAGRGVRATIESLTGNITQIQVNDVQVGYYEYECDVSQAILRPTYIMGVTFTERDADGSDLTFDGEIHMWADAPPLSAQIDSPPDSTVVAPGTNLCFLGSAQGGEPPFSFQWEKVGVKYTEGPIGTGETVCADMIQADTPEGPAEGEIVRLTVTDALGAQATDYVDVVFGEFAVVGADLAHGFDLMSVKPNPAGGTATISFSLGSAMDIEAAIFDVRGRTVRVLAAGRRFPEGSNSISWDGRDQAGRLVSGGVYWVRVRAGRQEAVRKLVLIR
jgi:hypothetical protein